MRPEDAQVQARAAPCVRQHLRVRVSLLPLPQPPGTRAPFTVSLTKTKPARKEMKVELIEEVRAAAAKYAAVYVFSHENMRTEP